MIRIHNSLTGEKQELQPIRPGHIGMYVSGKVQNDLPPAIATWLKA